MERSLYAQKSLLNSYKMELRHSSFRSKLTFLKLVHVEIRLGVDVKNLDPSGNRDHVVSAVWADRKLTETVGAS